MNVRHDAYRLAPGKNVECIQFAKNIMNWKFILFSLTWNSLLKCRWIVLWIFFLLKKLLRCFKEKCVHYDVIEMFWLSLYYAVCELIKSI
jgi:hypothetical protein